MAAISRAYKCVFVHIPKCGGMTVEQYLIHWGAAFRQNQVRLPGVPHPTTGKIFAMHPEYFRFTFVRNPYDRFVSYYYHGRRLQRRGGLHFYRNIHECLEFTAEILECADFEKVKPPRLGTALPQEDFRHWTWWHSRRQKDFLPEHNPEIYLGVKRTDSKPLSFIGRLENFDEDFLHVRKILRLPRAPVLSLNVSKKRGHYSEYYDAAARRRIEELYAEDLEILGYEYERKGVARSLPPLYDLKRAEQCAPEFSRKERRLLFQHALYFNARRTLRITPLALLWRLLPRRLRWRLRSQRLLKTG